MASRQFRWARKQRKLGNCIQCGLKKENPLRVHCTACGLKNKIRMRNYIINQRILKSKLKKKRKKNEM